MEGGVLRLMFAEGQFPIFPWLVFFISGIFIGDKVAANDIQSIVKTAIVIMIIAGVFMGSGLLFPELAASHIGKRFFAVRVPFYPALTPISTLLLGSSILLTGLILLYEKKYKISENNLLVYTGRLSLTILFVHIIGVREMAHIFGFWRTYSNRTVSFLIILFLIVILITAWLWQKKSYKFSLEWLMRVVSQKTATRNNSGK